MPRSKPEVSGNDVADAEADARHHAREAVVRRACEVMGWDYKTSPAYSGIRAVALGRGVAVSVEKLHAMLDEIVRLRAAHEPQASPQDRPVPEVPGLSD